MEKSGISIWKKSLSDTIQQDKQVESVALSAIRREKDILFCFDLGVGPANRTRDLNYKLLKLNHLSGGESGIRPALISANL
jgi:hypothetical protein